MKRDEVFPSKYLKAADLKGKPMVVTIETADLEQLKNQNGEEQAKTVLTFVGSAKSLPLNMVNWDSVADICGADTDDWPGKKVELFPAKTQLGSKIVPCIRIRPPEQRELPTSKSRPTPRPATPPADDMDDNIPFN